MSSQILNIVLANPYIDVFRILFSLILISGIVYLFYRWQRRHELRNKDFLSDKQVKYINIRKQEAEYMEEKEQKRIETEKIAKWKEKQIEIRRETEERHDKILAQQQKELEIASEKKRKERVEDLLKKQKKMEEFLGSSEYKYIEQFAKKYKDGESNSEFIKFQTLLENKGWEFEKEELKSVLNQEHKKQKVKDSKIKILANNASSRNDFLITYLDFFGSNDSETLEGLAEILQEKQLYFEDLTNLKTEIKQLEKEIELKTFEKRLFDEDEIDWLENIDSLNGYEFEDFLKNLFSKMGYQVKQTRLSGDQGADVVVIKFGEKTVIQAKCYGGKVGNKAVQEIMAAISLYKAQKGMVITNNYFISAAVELANANNIELVDRDGLEKMINNHW